MADMFRYERGELVRAIRGEGVDVVHGHWTYEFGWAAIDSGLPHVVTAHDSPWEVVRHTRTLYRLGRYLMARHVIRRARFMTAVGPTVKADIERYARVSVLVVPNPVPESVFALAGKGYGKRLGIGRRRIAMVSNGWSEFKNPVPALQAFAEVRRQLNDAELHCFGAGYGVEDSGSRWARREGLGEGVYFHGSRPHQEVLEGVAGAVALLHPSRLEACSMAVAEAMSMGVPVIGGSGTPAVAWQLDGGKAGVLVDVGSPGEIASAILSLLASGEQAEAIGVAGRRRARDLFSVDGVVGQYEAAYRAVI